MVHEYELGYGSEIRGHVCPKGGCSLLFKYGRAYCDEHGYVEPVEEQLPPLDEGAGQVWLDEHDRE